MLHAAPCPDLCVSYARPDTSSLRIDARSLCGWFAPCTELHKPLSYCKALLPPHLYITLASCTSTECESFAGNAKEA
eukprot:1149325-Pelagomonas_calceolata.AAC.3